MNCFPPSIDGPSGVSDILRSVDCETSQVTRFAFERIFGTHGALGFALTALLSIYVALLAVNLLTGRSTLRLSLLTPRALTIGLVLTFATSWFAYQEVVWNLAVGAPDQIAAILIGSHGSAIHLFAGQLDRLFTAITAAAQAASAVATDAAHKNAPFAPSDLLWFSAVLLLLGTAGVLIVARIALAAMLAIGPLFIVLALFENIRGLFEGWLRGVILFAVIPLLTVLVGGGALLLLDPMVQSLTLSGDAPSMQMALGVLMGSCIYTALMVMAIKAATVLTSAIRLTKADPHVADGHAPNAQPAIFATSHSPVIRSVSRDDRIRELVTAMQSSMSAPSPRSIERARLAQQFPNSSPKVDRSSSSERLRGINTRFRQKKGFQP